MSAKSFSFDTLEPEELRPLLEDGSDVCLDIGMVSHFDRLRWVFHMAAEYDYIFRISKNTIDLINRGE